MDNPTELEMAQTRQRLREFPNDYLEAVATHHSRVARLAVDMQRVTKLSKYASVYPQEQLEKLAELIEQSFAEAFGVRLRSAANSNDIWEDVYKNIPPPDLSKMGVQLVGEIAFQNKMAFMCPKCWARVDGYGNGCECQKKAADEATESREKTE